MLFGGIGFKLNSPSKGLSQPRLLILETFFILLFDFLQIFTSLENGPLDKTHERRAA